VTPRVASIVSLLFALALCGVAHAQTAPRPERADRVRAEAELKRGMKLIAEQQYDEAIAALSAAYELDPKSEHLYNLGVAYQLKGDKRSALDRYRQFLAAGSTNRQLVKAAERYAAELEAAIAAEEQAAKEAADAEAARKAADEEAARKAAEEEARRKAAEQADRQARERAAQTSPAPSRAGRTKRIAGASMAAAGAAALGVAVVAALEARSANDELDRLETGDNWDVSREWLHDRGESAEQRALIFAAVGAGLTAGGVVLYVLGERDARGAERSVVIAPAVGAGGAGVTLRGAF
jgi:tetratricopeptide (TPR) repeat protein